LAIGIAVIVFIPGLHIYTVFPNSRIGLRCVRIARILKGAILIYWIHAVVNNPSFARAVVAWVTSKQKGRTDYYR
jgi:hypothetical protein